MRKIVSKHEEEKKRKRNQIVVGGILIFVMILSTLGFAFQNFIISGGTTTGNANQTVKYNGFVFSQQNNYWVLNTNKGRFVFTYNPSEINSSLDNLTLDLSSFENRTLYLYSGENLNADSEVRINMKNLAGNLQEACPPGMICSNSVNQTITASCADNFIIIENGTSGVRQNQNCIYISGQGDSLIKLIDDVLFKILGVKK
jgi:hypothetical protein